jgi:hypothetical protein
VIRIQLQEDGRAGDIFEVDPSTGKARKAHGEAVTRGAAREAVQEGQPADEGDGPQGRPQVT